MAKKKTKKKAAKKVAKKKVTQKKTAKKPAKKTTKKTAKKATKKATATKKPVKKAAPKKKAPAEPSGPTVGPGDVIWTELHSTNPVMAADFYTKLLGWKTKSMPMGGDMGDYTMWNTGGADIGGFAQAADGAPSQFLIYFMVTDVDAVLAQALDMGAEQILPPSDIPQGRFAILKDPTGASFALFKPAPM